MARFKREYDIGRTVHYGGLIPMIEYGDDGRSPSSRWSAPPGKSRRRLIERGGPFSEPRSRTSLATHPMLSHQS